MASLDKEENPADLSDSDNASIDTEQFTRFTLRQKYAITALVSIGAFLPPLSATMVASALPQVQESYGTTATTLNLSNAAYLIAAGLSPLFIGPLSTLYGRKPILLVVAVCYTAFSLGTGLSPTFGSYLTFRILTAFAATGFLTTGNTCLGDIWHPTQRGRAGGWFLLAFELGPTLGPFIGGAMVTFVEWRSQFYLQAGLGAVVGLLFVVLLPETAAVIAREAFAGESFSTKAKKTAVAINPFRVVSLFGSPAVLAAGLGSGSLAWNMYSLLTPITYVLNPRFGLTSPLQSAFFFLAPGAGYIVGALTGGYWADFVVDFYMKRRNGTRLPEDRLKACLPFLGIVGPVSVILYGWSIQKEFGGIALPVIMMFIQAFAQLIGYLTINPYCLDVMQAHGRSADVMASNYAARYAFGAAGIASALPIIQSAGVGWLSVLSGGLMLLATLALGAAIAFGPGRRDHGQEKSAANARLPA